MISPINSYLIQITSFSLWKIHSNLLMINFNRIRLIMLLEERRYLVKILSRNIQRIWIRYPRLKMRKNRLLDVWRNWWNWYRIIRSYKMDRVRWSISNFITSMGNNSDINKETLVENLNFRIYSQTYSQNIFK